MDEAITALAQSIRTASWRTSALINAVTSARIAACVSALALALPALAAGALSVEPGAYDREISKWRAGREADLKADDGWLTLAGLFWLKEGTTSFGSDPSNGIVLPPGAAPAHAGVFTLTAGKVSVRVLDGVAVMCAGKPVTAMDLLSDNPGKPDVLSLGALRMNVIRRGDRYGIRLKDGNSAQRKAFKGLRWFPVDPAARVTAKFVPYDPPKEIDIPTVLGTTEKAKCPGYVVFRLNGQDLRLDPIQEDTDTGELFFIFRDATAGKETYPPGRFLYADAPKDGFVVLDFNKAHNPPCAYTTFATCPLPPPQNRLKVRIAAGELNDGSH